MSSPPDPKKIAAGHIEKILSNNHLPVPRQISLGKKSISISDLSVSIENFRYQRDLLLNSGQRWPCVKLKEYASDSAPKIHWAPLDLGTASNPSGNPDEIFSGVAVRRALDEGQAAGLQTQEIASDVVDKTFSEMVGAVIGKRLTGDAAGNDEPPPNLFEVTTDSVGVEIVYSVGYFISTKRGFGFSTPARRELRWGPYLFGTCIGGNIEFSDTLWAVPDVSSIHLSV